MSIKYLIRVMSRISESCFGLKWKVFNVDNEGDDVVEINV